MKAPTDRIAFVFIGIGALGLLAVVSGGVTMTLLGLAFAALMGFTGVHQLFFGRGAVRTHAALQALTRGQMEEAEAHLDAISPWAARNGAIMRSTAYQRGLIAFYRGDAARATALLEPASGARTRLFTRTQELLLRAYVLSVRALAFASTGDAARARADVTAVLESEHALPDALARARLAEAVVLGREGAHDALAAFFREHGSLVLEHALPRERVLARALRKMVTSRARSVYRESARPDDGSTETNAVGDWIARIAPEAAPHAAQGPGLVERADAAAPPEVSDKAVRAFEETRRRSAKDLSPRGPSRQWKKTLILWAVLIALFLVVYQLLGSATPVDDTLPSGPELARYSGVLVGLAILAAIGIAAAVAVRRNRKTVRDIVAASRAVMVHDLVTAEPLLAALEQSTQNLGAAQAFGLRAGIAEREGRFGDCIVFCDRGLASIASQVHANRVVASMTVTPALEALRSVALAALGREAEATAALAVFGKAHPTWSNRASAELRIRLMLAVKRGDFDAARAIARERTPELPITLRDEALADLVLAVAPNGASRDEQERVDTEIREDLTIRTWIDAVAPELRDDLARRVSAKDVRVRTDEQVQRPLIDDEDADEEEVDTLAAHRQA